MWLRCSYVRGPVARIAAGGRGRPTAGAPQPAAITARVTSASGALPGDAVRILGMRAILASGRAAARGRSARLLHPIGKSLHPGPARRMALSRSTYGDSRHRGCNDTLRHFHGANRAISRNAPRVDAARPSVLAIVTQRARPATADTGVHGRRSARQRRSRRRTRAPARDRGATAGPPAAQRSRRPRVVPARRDGLLPPGSRSRCLPATSRVVSSSAVRRPRHADRPARRRSGLSAARPGRWALTIAFTRTASEIDREA
jgi:hypothetical protein